jgi:hypothetical protein
MTRHSVNEGAVPSGLATFSWNGSVGINFKLAVPLPFTEIWYYSQAGTVLPTKCGLFDNNGTLVPGTLKTSPSWSGAVGSGWVKTTYDGSITIPAGLTYQAACYINGTGGFGTTGGNAPVDNGLITAGQATFDNNGTPVPDLTYTTGINVNVFMVDVGVDTPSVFSASDDFNRADGGLGANWLVSPDTTDDPTTLAIVSNQVKTSDGAHNSGSIWVGSAASDDQYAQLTIEALPGASNWLAVGVRMSGNGKNQYIVIAYNNAGTYVLQLFKRIGGVYTSLGGEVWPSPIVGDVIKLAVIGNSLTAYQNGVPIVGATDSDLTWGQPGIATFSTQPMDNWSAGNIDITPTIALSSTSGHVSTYSVASIINQHNVPPPTGPQDMRVLTPTSPSSRYAHAFLWLLPVEPGQGSTFGDPIAQVQALGLQDTYNLTCIQPGFPFDPWYANNDTDPNTQEETFMRQLVAWAKAHLAITGSEVHYLIGFSKSGIGGQRLFWRNQDLFAAVASWDFPGQETYSQFGGDSAEVYGSQANFDANYAVTDAHLTTWKANGDTGTKNRVWIAGGVSFTGDVSTYDGRLTSLSIDHTYVSNSYTVHNWVSSPDWVGPAVAFLAGVGPPPTGGLLMSSLI